MTNIPWQARETKLTDHSARCYQWHAKTGRIGGRRKQIGPRLFGSLFKMCINLGVKSDFFYSWVIPDLIRRFQRFFEGFGVPIEFEGGPPQRVPQQKIKRNANFP